MVPAHHRSTVSEFKIFLRTTALPLWYQRVSPLALKSLERGGTQSPILCRIASLWLRLSYSGRELKSSRPTYMVFHIKTILVIDDNVMRRLREESARQGATISELVEAALRRALEPPPRTAKLPSLPGFDGGGCLVDIADGDALYQAMEGR